MLLLDLVIPTRVNARWQYSGMDSIEGCAKKTHFKNYPYPVEYVYNSRGFRDAEWPESVDELRNAIWCVGDSFTVGLGSPLEHTWPYLLQQQAGRRCINISMDGASNDWIARKTQRLIEEINPADIVIMWSYTSRREKNDDSLSDEDRRTQGSTQGSALCNGLENAINFKSCMDSLSHSNITHTAVPDAYDSQNVIINELTTLYNTVADPSWPQEITNRATLETLPLHILNELKSLEVYNQISDGFDTIDILDHCDRVYKIKQVTQLDRARDFHHFDKLTSQWFIEQICQ